MAQQQAPQNPVKPMKTPIRTLIHTIAKWTIKVAQVLGISLILATIASLIANILTATDLTATVVYHIGGFFSPPATGYTFTQISVIVITFVILGLILLAIILNSALSNYEKPSKKDLEQQKWEEEQRQNMQNALAAQREIVRKLVEEEEIQQKRQKELRDEQQKRQKELRDEQQKRQKELRDEQQKREDTVFQRFLIRVVNANKDIDLQALLSQSQITLPTSLPGDEVFQSLCVAYDLPFYDVPGEQLLRNAYITRYKDLYTEAYQSYAQPLRRVWQSESKPNTPQKILSATAILQSLTATRPLAVLLGTPGSGKSTLLRWFALRMAQVYLTPPDPVPTELGRVQVPLLVHLNAYAKRLNRENISLKEFISHSIGTDYVNIPVTIREKIEQGHCLILLDGLDEISSIALRRRVVEAIHLLLASPIEKNAPPHQFNRFILTSRIIDYEQGRLSNYLHYTLLDLYEDHTKEFLKRSLTALHHDHATEILNPSVQYVKPTFQTPEYLLHFYQQRPSLASLATNPQMLVLMLLFSVSGRDLNSAYYLLELYEQVAHTLLYSQEREGIIDASPLSNKTFVERLLGNLAFRLHKRVPSISVLSIHEIQLITRRTLAVFTERRMSEIEESKITQTIAVLRKSTGIIAKVGNELFCIPYPALQNHFVALHLLRKTRAQFKQFLLSHYNQAHWREPLLLTIVHKSRRIENKGKREVNDLFRSLLNTKNDYDDILHTHLFFALDMAIAQQDSHFIDPALQRELVNRLFDIYGSPLQVGRYTLLRIEIQNRFFSWLNTSSLKNVQQSPPPPVLDAWKNALNLAMVPSLVRLEGALRLLAQIAPQLDGRSPFIFYALIPSLIELAQLPTLQDFPYPSAVTTRLPFSLQESVPLLIEEIAHYTARVFGANGPSHWLYAKWNEWNQQEPWLLELLTQHSFALDSLLSPVTISDDEQKLLLSTWKHLPQSNLATLQPSLFKATDRAHYPSAYIYRQVLLYEQSQTMLAWNEAWDNFLKQQMESNHVGTYYACFRLRLLLAGVNNQQYQRLASELEVTLSIRETQGRRQQALAINTIAHLYLQDQTDSLEGKTLQKLFSPLWAEETDVDFTQDKIGTAQYIKHRSNLRAKLDPEKIIQHLCDLLTVSYDSPLAQNALLALCVIISFKRSLSPALNELIRSSVRSFNGRQKSLPLPFSYRLLLAVIMRHAHGSPVPEQGNTPKMDIHISISLLKDLQQKSHIQAEDVRLLLSACADTRAIPQGTLSQTTASTVGELSRLIVVKYSFLLDHDAIQELLHALISRVPSKVETSIWLLRYSTISPLHKVEVAQKVRDVLTNENVFVPLTLINVLGYPKVSKLYDQLFEILKSVVEEKHAELSELSGRL